MYETIRMQVLSSVILLENQYSENEVLAKTILSNITLLRYLGAVTCNEDFTDLSHILTEAALQSPRISEQGKDEIKLLINNEEQNDSNS